MPFFHLCLLIYLQPLSLFYIYIAAVMIRNTIKVRNKSVLFAPDKQQQLFPLAKTITNRSNQSTLANVMNELEEEVKKYKKMVKDLENCLKQERQRYKQLQEKVSLLARRTIDKEKEFHKIIKNNIPALFKWNSQYVNENNQIDETELQKLSKKIYDNFQESNKATNQYLENMYHNNLTMIGNRIAEIMEVYDIQLGKCQKITSIDKLSLQKTLEEVLSIAKGIQEDNIKSKKTIEALTLKTKLLQEEKQLLIQQVVQKKKIIERLYIENKRQKEELNKSQVLFSSGPAQQTKLQLRHLTKNVKNDAWVNRIFGGSAGLTQEIQNDFAHQIESTHLEKEVKSQNLDLMRNSVKDDQQFITQSLSKKPAIFHLHASKDRYNERQDKSKPHQAKSLSTNKIHQQVSAASKKSANYDKIIERLKTSLEREKRKNYELSKLLTKLQNQNEQINSAIAQSINHLKKEKNNAQAVEMILKSEKLFETIRVLKQRLAMMEKPAFVCGWGENQLDLEEESKLLDGQS